MTSAPLSSSKFRILLLENIHAVARDLFLQQGYEVETLKGALPPGELIAKLKGFDAVGVRSKTDVPALVFDQAPQLLTLGAFCVGTNHLAVDAAKRNGIPVFNAPFSNTRSVAEMTLSNIIALSRQVGTRNVEMHQGVWNKKSDGCFEVRGKTLGIVGYGNIGTQISAMAEAIGMRTVFYDVLSKLPLGNAKPMPSLENLLQESDFVTLHVPETSFTVGMMGSDELKQMKKGAYLINASRGTVVDLPALAKSLGDKHLAGAAIDVFPVEPANNSQPFDSPLKGLYNVILTPHIGGATEEAQSNIGREVASNIIRFLENGSTEQTVNFPVISSSATSGHRLLNVHHNVPGVLKDINEIIAEGGVNIESQHLSTEPEIGYLVMGFDKALPESALKRIESLKSSIRTRILG